MRRLVEETQSRSLQGTITLYLLLFSSFWLRVPLKRNSTARGSPSRLARKAFSLQLRGPGNDERAKMRNRCMLYMPSERKDDSSTAATRWKANSYLNAKAEKKKKESDVDETERESDKKDSPQPTPLKQQSKLFDM